MTNIITTAVADYGTRKILTEAVAQENLYSFSAAMGFSTVDSSTTGIYRSPFTNIGNAVNESVTNNEYDPVEASTDADILPIDRRAVFSEKIGAFDEINFASGSLITDRAMNGSKVMAQSIDRFVINKAISEVGSSLGDAGVAGATTPWAVTTSNALEIVNRTVEEVNFNEGYGDDKFILVDTSFVKNLTGYFQGTGNNVADDTIRTGLPYVGMLAGGVKVFQSNNVPHEATITFGAIAVAGDTVSVNGVVYTYVASIGTTPGNLLVGANAAASQAALLGALNAPGTTTATYVALGLNDQNKIKNLAGTASSASTVLTFAAKGAFRLTETFTSGSNVVSAVSKRLLAGSMGAVKIFVPSVGMQYTEKDEISGFDGIEIHMRQFFNSMTETRKVPLTTSVLVS